MTAAEEDSQVSDPDEAVRKWGTDRHAKAIYRRSLGMKHTFRKWHWAAQVNATWRVSGKAGKLGVIKDTSPFTGASGGRRFVVFSLYYEHLSGIAVYSSCPAIAIFVQCLPLLCTSMCECAMKLCTHGHAVGCSLVNPLLASPWVGNRPLLLADCLAAIALMCSIIDSHWRGPINHCYLICITTLVDSASLTCHQ